VWLLTEPDPGTDPVVNLAWEEALLRAGPTEPLLRLWRCEPCVVLGRGQRVAREVDEVACQRDGIPVLRRSSGGGTVYLDPGTLVVTLVRPGRHPALTADLAAVLAGALADLGVRVVAAPRGLFAAGPDGPVKVSGLAAQVTAGASLAHATLLLTTDADRVARYLTPAPAVPHPLDSQRSRTAALCRLGAPAEPAPVVAALLARAAMRYGPPRVRPPHAGEIACRDELLARRYRHGPWHRSGRTEERTWTRRPVLSCTG
jgi:lipoate-protein ligase A